MAIWKEWWCSLKALVHEMVGQIPSYSKYYCYHFQRISSSTAQSPALTNAPSSSSTKDTKPPTKIKSSPIDDLRKKSWYSFCLTQMGGRSCCQLRRFQSLFWRICHSQSLWSWTVWPWWGQHSWSWRKLILFVWPAQRPKMLQCLLTSEIPLLISTFKNAAIGPRKGLLSQRIDRIWKRIYRNAAHYL